MKIRFLRNKGWQKRKYKELPRATMGEAGAKENTLETAQVRKDGSIIRER
jgi:hypothetical protein